MRTLYDLRLDKEIIQSNEEQNFHQSKNSFLSVKPVLTNIFQKFTIVDCLSDFLVKLKSDVTEFSIHHQCF